ncbi:hypothetical protein NDU88_003900 [Pleurodeles waltl]|uniref:Uncharacterized protein n=1 Tax=Pleurodeles waltl TaxID=8319 RepID=A0AAV7V3U0_PLEWA|nr:hypothetical protein NDU88_003900 [Pleurodeles waltl]
MYGRALTPFQDGGAVRRAPEGPLRLGRAGCAQYTLTAKPRLENPIKAGRGGGRARLSQPTPPGFPCCKPSPGVRVCQGVPGRRLACSWYLGALPSRQQAP